MTDKKPMPITVDSVSHGAPPKASPAPWEQPTWVRQESCPECDGDGCENCKRTATDAH